MTRLATLLSLGLLGLGTAACGGGGGGGGDDSSGIHVDAALGSDVTGDGTTHHPYKTITRATAYAGTGDTIHVAAGTYDEANGEWFPIRPFPGVTVVGATAPNPAGGTLRLTHVVGGGFWIDDPQGRLHGTIVPNVDDRFVGMTFENPQPFVVGGAKPAAVVVADVRVTLEDCSFQNSDKGMRLVEGADEAYTKGCAFVGNSIGVFVDGATSDANVFQDCYVSGNGVGVMAFTEGADFGSDVDVSAGGNVFSANTNNDVVNAAGPGAILFANLCFWDHTPPTFTFSGTDPAADVWLLDVASNVIVGDARLYDPNHPPPAHP